MQAERILEARNSTLAGAREGSRPFPGAYRQAMGFEPPTPGVVLGLAAGVGLLTWLVGPHRVGLDSFRAKPTAEQS